MADRPTSRAEHAATVREELTRFSIRGRESKAVKACLAALDALVALAARADELERQLREVRDAYAASSDRLVVEILEREEAEQRAERAEREIDLIGDRGDHLVYRDEWERFDRWQRAVAAGKAEAVDFVGAEQLAADRVNVAEARADELERERDEYKALWHAATGAWTEASERAERAEAALREIADIPDPSDVYVSKRHDDLRTLKDVVQTARAALGGRP